MSVWNNTYESHPDPTQSAGGPGLDAVPPQIQTLKTDIRQRAQCEMDFGTQNGSDTGRLRLGAARPFYQNTAPTALLVTDFSSSTALDSGRVWVDTGTNGTVSRRRVLCYDAGTPGWLEAGANCGQLPLESAVNGRTGGFFTATTWVKAVTDITLVTPTAFNGEQFTLVMDGMITASNPSAGTSYNFEVAISTGGVPGVGTVQVHTGLTMGWGGQPSGTATLKVGRSIAAAANTTYVISLCGYSPTINFDRGFVSSSPGSLNGSCVLRVQLLNGGAT